MVSPFGKDAPCRGQQVTAGGFCTLLALKKQALSLSLRKQSAIMPSSLSSNSRRSEMRTSVGIFVWTSPIAWYW